MPFLCAWCRQALGLAEELPSDESGVNYGICQKCLSERMAELVARRLPSVHRESQNGDG